MKSGPEEGASAITHIYKNGILTNSDQEPVREFPLQLHVNGRELATLIASPHELRFLVAGFLRLQGFVKEVADFQVLSVCEDAGIANVVLRNQIPERLTPVLTSGCGTGLTFSIPEAFQNRTVNPARRFKAGEIFSIMDELARRAEMYRRHGGIHSAAVADGKELLLYAEDLGRHNTIDRLAGEALLRGIDLGGCLLATSGRVSSEMVAKSAVLGIGLIASRTSPTDMAVRLCKEMGIHLVGYVRGGGFTIYGPHDALDL
jgi:FdhD protein